MQYMLLIYSEEKREPVPGTEAFGKYMEGFKAFSQEVQTAGAMISGNALQPVATSTTVRAPGGKMTTTDGPFAETKETLGGYYILDCKDLDEAMAYAAKIPSAEFGCVEVRPVMVFD